VPNAVNVAKTSNLLGTVLAAGLGLAACGSLGLDGIRVGGGVGGNSHVGVGVGVSVGAPAAADEESREAASLIRIPTRPPSPARGEQVYARVCGTCHGAGGRGDGPEAEDLAITVPDFTDPEFMRGWSPADFYLVLREGRGHQGMPPWGETLGDSVLWDLIAWAWTRRLPSPGRELDGCRGCHLADPESSMASALSEPARLIYRRDEELAATLSAIAGHPGRDQPHRTALLARWLAFERPR
jgi:hypothetical protein